MKGLRQLSLLLMGVLILLATSCDFKIYQDLEPCNLYIRYKYDYNILSADAFSSRVNKVSLFIFDQEGKLVKSVEVVGNPFEDDYRQEIQLSLGTYQMVAWAGLDDASYDLTGGTTIETMRLAIKSTNGLSDKSLSHLWHGLRQEVVVHGTPEEVIVIPLVKDTNTFRVQLLASDNSDVVDITDYKVSIESDNGQLNGLNEVITGHKLTYHPYMMQQMDVQEDNKIYYGGAVYELRTGRLMAQSNDRIIIRGMVEGVETVLVNLKLQDLLGSLRLSAYSQYPLQEYLDRQDEYVISFIFGKMGDFTSIKVMINGWLVRESGYEA